MKYEKTEQTLVFGHIIELYFYFLFEITLLYLCNHLFVKKPEIYIK